MWRSTNHLSAVWQAPAEADVPAGTGLTVTITCVVNDKWDGEATGVAAVAGDTGTRNDGASPAQTATILVQRAPCGRWQHKSWQASELEWGTDSNGDPEPLAPKDATEIVQWVDECGGPAKADQERKVPYTLVSDGPIEIEGVWHRKVEYRAYSTCAGGTDSELLSGERALPRHWSVPGELDGGSMSIELTGAGTAGLTSPGVVTPGSTTALILPSGGGMSLNVSQAKDTDTYSYWNVPEKTADDAIIYKWTVTDEDGNETELDTTAATSSWSGTAAGTYVITGTVDDAWSVDEDGVKESGVTEPDLGERNDDEIVYVVAVTVVAREWDLSQAIGLDWKRDANGSVIPPDADGNRETIENGLMLAPQDQRKRDAQGQPLPAQGVAGTDYRPEEIFVRPGQELDCQVQDATDWDHWSVALGQPPADKQFSPPYQDWEKDTVKYQWSATGPQPGSFADATQAATKWTAPTGANGQEVAGTYVLTCTISDAWDGEATGVAAPATGTRNDGDIVRTVEVIVRESDSWAELKVFASDSAGEPEDEEAQGAIGGKLWAQLKMTVGTNQQLDPAQTGVTVRVEETDSLHAGQTSPLPYFDTALSLTQDWEYLRDRDAQGALLPEAQWQWVEGGNPTQVKDYPVQYRQRFSWDSTKKPLGHNGEHLVSLVGANTQLRFVKLNGETYESGPQSKNADVQNLVIEDVSTSNGTEDYFKWDPTGDDNSLKNPTIDFTIKDEGNPRDYQWIVFFNKTAEVHRDDNTDWTSDAYHVSGTSNGAGPVTIDLTDINLEGHLDEGVHERSPYTFDIRVLKFDADSDIFETGILDTAQFKQPYTEWIPNQFSDSNGVTREGHTVTNVISDETDDYDLRASYYLYPNPATANAGAANFSMIPMDPNFLEREAASGPNSAGVWHGGEDGMSVYKIKPQDPDGEWRVIFVGDDASGPEVRRDHTFQRIIPVNKTLESESMFIFTDQHFDRTVPTYASGGSAKYYAIWVNVKRASRSIGHTPNTLAKVSEHMANYSGSYLSSPSAKPGMKWGVINGGYFGGGGAIGAVGSGGWTYQKPIINYDNPSRYLRRWSFGMNDNPSSPNFKVKLDNWRNNPQGYWAPPTIQAFPHGLDGLQALIVDGSPQVHRVAGGKGGSDNNSGTVYLNLPFQRWTAQNLYPGYTFSAVGSTSNKKWMFLVASVQGSKDAVDMRDLFGKFSPGSPVEMTAEVYRDLKTPNSPHNETWTGPVANPFDINNSYVGPGHMMSRFAGVMTENKYKLPTGVGFRIGDAVLLDGGSAVGIQYQLFAGRRANKTAILEKRGVYLPAPGERDVATVIRAKKNPPPS